MAMISSGKSTGTHLYTMSTPSVRHHREPCSGTWSGKDFGLPRFPMALLALEHAANENIFVLKKVAGECPAYTRFSKPPLLQGCPLRGTTSRQYRGELAAKTVE